MGKPPGIAQGAPEFRWDEVAATGEEDDRPGRQTNKRRLRKAILDRQNALHELLNAIQGTDYAHAVLESNKTIDHAEVPESERR